MMRRYEADNDDFSPSGLCPRCADRDPCRRASHHLDLARMADLDGLKAHLTEQYVKLREPGFRREDLVHDLCGWVGNMIEQYSGLADPTTGAKLAWWEARQYLRQHKEAMARTAYDRAPEDYRATREQAGGAVAARSVVQGGVREPGDDDLATL